MYVFLHYCIPELQSQGFLEKLEHGFNKEIQMLMYRNNKTANIINAIAFILYHLNNVYNIIYYYFTPIIIYRVNCHSG